MHVNKHPPPLIRTYTYRHSVLYPHTHKIHVLETTSLQFHPPDTITLHYYKNQIQYTLPLHWNTSQQQISGNIARLLAINPNKQISGPPNYSSKKFRDLAFSPPTPPPTSPPPPLQLKFWLVPYDQYLTNIYTRLRFLEVIRLGFLKRICLGFLEVIYFGFLEVNCLWNPRSNVPTAAQQVHPHRLLLFPRKHFPHSPGSH